MAAKKKITEWSDYNGTEFLDSEEAMAEYLNLELEEGDPRYIKIALGNIARARSNMSELAKKAGLPRTTLYRALSLDGNPEYKTIHKIVNALDMRLLVVPKSRARTNIRRQTS